MAFAPGDRVHVASLGTGLIRAVRNGGRYLVEIKGKTVVVDGREMDHAAPPRTVRRRTAAVEASEPLPPHAAASLDLHGLTADAALAALDAFLNDALLASLAEGRIIHGRSGGRIREAVHRRLRELPPVRSYLVDPRNAGVTIVTL